MSSPNMPFGLAANRYELGVELDRGGMGTVFIAYDTYQNRRKVALKTISGTPEGVHLELFQRELSVLASLSHPNIVDVYDSGYLDDPNGARKPFFVMPLLDGETLDKRLSRMGGRAHFSVDESIHIIDQVVRGLMAAHGRGIIHRDLKPSNVFVLPDLSVKIIDFGVAQLVGANTKSGQKGTLLYMAPEQVAENQSSALSDQFSLGVLFYEILTGRRAFERDNEKKVIDAILREIPPIATELDRSVPMALSQIVHKMLAKKPERRFASMRDVIDTLQKFVRREQIEYFNPDNFEQSFQSARAAFQRKNYELASEILYTIEAEGYVDAEALRMRHEALAAIRGSRVARDLKYAHELLADGNFVLAGEKVAAVLATDPDNVDALALDKEVRKKIEAQSIASLKKVARQHIANRNFDRARESLERVLKLNETDSEALQTLNDVDREDLEFRRLIGKQQGLYQSARRAWQQGEVTSALSKIERVLSLDSDLQSPDPEQRTAYERFYQEVRAHADSLRAARAEIQRSLDRREFAKAREICDGVLAEDPNHAAFQALRVDIEDRHQRALLETIADVDAKLGREPRLDERLRILEDATARFPGEPHFERHLEATRRKQDTVNRLVEKARLLEEQRRYEEAVNLWEIVETTYGAFPGLPFELTRVRELRDEKHREERREELTMEVERYLEFNDYDKADSAVRDGRVELPSDPAIELLAHKVAGHRGNSEEAARLLKEGRVARESKNWPGAVEALRGAYELEPRNREMRAEYLFTLAAMARVEAESSPSQARELVAQGLRVEPTHTGLRALASQIDLQLQSADVAVIARRASAALSEGDLSAAMSAVEEGFRIAPGQAELEELQRKIHAEFMRQSDLDTLQRIQLGLEEAPASVDLVRTNLAVVHQIGARSGGDQRIAALSDDLTNKLSGLMTRFESPSDPRVTQVDLKPPLSSSVIDVSPLSIAPQTAVQRPAATIPAATIKTASPMAVATPAGVSRTRWRMAALVSAAVVVLAIAGVALLKRMKVAPPVAQPVELSVEAVPAGAEISIDGVPAGRAPLTKALLPGDHLVVAKRPGFKELEQRVQLGAAADKIVLAMAQDGIPIHFVTDYRGMIVKVDGKPFLDEEQKSIAQGSLVPEDAGHVIETSSGTITARFSFGVKAGKVELRGPAAMNLTKAAMLVVPGGGAAPHWLLPNDAEVLVDGVSITKKPDTAVAAGQHQVKMGAFEGSFQVGDASEVWVFLSSGKLFGHLAVTSNVSNAEIFLDGEKKIVRTPATIPSVQVRNVRLRVEKAGYEPYVAVVPLTAGGVTVVNAPLKKLP